MKPWLIGIWVIALLIPAPLAAQFYRYTDARGNVRFTDDINQVPEDQRARVRRYAEAAAPETEAAPEPAKSSTAGRTAPDPAAPPDTEAEAPGSLEDIRARIEERKKRLEAEYRALADERAALAQEKEARKSREQIHAYNRRVEAFNQRAARYEEETETLRREVEAFNRRLIEENARASGGTPPRN